MHDMKTPKYLEQFRFTNAAAQRRTPAHEEGPVRPPIKISQLAYLISRLLIYRSVLNRFSISWTSPGSSDRSIGLFLGRCFICVYTRALWPAAMPPSLNRVPPGEY